MQKLSVCANEDGFDAHSVARIAFDAHTVFLHVFFFLHVLMKSVFRCYGNQSTRYILYFKSRSDLRNATLLFVYFLSI